MTAIKYRAADADGLKTFYREAGPGPSEMSQCTTSSKTPPPTVDCQS